MIDEQTINRVIRYMRGTPNIRTNVPYYPTKEQENDIKDMFKKLMNENVNKNLSPLNQQTLLEGVYESFANNDDYFKAFNFRSDNKHMQGYDNLLKEGEAKRIIDIFNSHGIGVDKLKGVPLFTPFDNYVDNEKTVYVKEEIERPDGKSPYVSLFEIYYNGELIYQWKGRAKGDGDIYANFKQQDEIKQKIKRKSKYMGSYYISEEELPIKEWVDKNGKTFYTQGSKRISRRYVL